MYGSDRIFPEYAEHIPFIRTDRACTSHSRGIERDACPVARRAIEEIIELYAGE